jgi:hypothetical protein
MGIIVSRSGPGSMNQCQQNVVLPLMVVIYHCTVWPPAAPAASAEVPGGALTASHGHPVPGCGFLETIIDLSVCLCLCLCQAAASWRPSCSWCGWAQTSTLGTLPTARRCRYDAAAGREPLPSCSALDAVCRDARHV